ncbi:hypothetical protein KP509_1Z121700 [Ceratopteris richardii]|nr:hypothetical protein KP509_1Z121700 [Ceratopteris richardii]
MHSALIFATFNCVDFIVDVVKRTTISFCGNRDSVCVLCRNSCIDVIHHVSLQALAAHRI